MKPRELCESAWEEIANNFLDFKAIKKGQNLKKVSKSKDITFEISFQSNRYNYSSSVRFSVHFLIQSKLMKKANINNGLVYGGELETIIDRGRIFHWFEIGGASYQSSVNEIIELLQKYIIPICDDFENTENNQFYTEKLAQVEEEKESLLEIMNKIENYDINNITPMDAMKFLFELKENITKRN